MTPPAERDRDDRHLWRRGAIWWLRLSLPRADGRRVPFRRSLRTRDLTVARQRRDALLAALLAPATAAAATPPLRQPATATVDAPDAAWNRLAAQLPHGDPFCCRSEWQLSFHEASAPTRTLFLRQADTAFLAFASLPLPGGRLRLEPLEAHWYFGSPLLGPDAVPALQQLLVEPELQRRRPEVVVSGLRPDGATLRQLLLAFAATHECLLLPPVEVVGSSLQGGLQGFLARRSAKLRRGLRQAARRAAAAGVRFERMATDGPAADAVFDRMLAVELQSWKGRGGCGMEQPLPRAFYAALLRRLRRGGHARVMFARRGDRDVGYIFGGCADGIYRGQQFSYVADLAPLSLGNLLQVEQVRWLAEEGVERYDLGPRMDYKAHWTELATPLLTVLLRPRRRRSADPRQVEA